MITIPTNPAALLRSVVATIVLLAVVIALASAIRPSGLALVMIVLWLLVIGVIAAGLFLIVRANRQLAGAGAIVTAMSVVLAFNWDSSAAPFVWTVGFLAGVVMVAMGTSQDTTEAAYWLLLLPRAGVGWSLVDNAQDHLRSKWLPGGGGFLQTASGAVKRQPAYFLDPLYQSFLKGTVVPNADTWAALTTCGELTFGLLLALGLLTPVAAVGAMWQNGNYMFMKGFAVHGAYTDKEFFAIELFCLIAGAGLAYGMDASLRRCVPTWVVETFMGVSGPEPEPAPIGRPQTGLSPMPPS